MQGSISNDQNVQMHSNPNGKPILVALSKRSLDPPSIPGLPGA